MGSRNKKYNIIYLCFTLYIKYNFNNFSKFLVRYVDDVFAIIDKDFNVEYFFQKINYQYSLIQIIYENEIEGFIKY